jgi:hypothetical protein
VRARAFDRHDVAQDTTACSAQNLFSSKTDNEARMSGRRGRLAVTKVREPAVQTDSQCELLA